MTSPEPGLGGLDHFLDLPRPAELDLDPGTSWLRLDVVATSAGGPFDTAGTVEFRAFFRHAEGRGALHEVSRFVREEGRWLYVDGDATTD